MHVARNYFSYDEDIKLLDLVEQYGTEQWNFIAREIKDRTPRQCRDRWTHYLDPSLNHNPWTQEENELLLQKVEELGCKWKIISAFFKNRTDVHIKNHYKTLKSKDKFHYRNIKQRQTMDEKASEYSSEYATDDSENSPADILLDNIFNIHIDLADCADGEFFDFIWN